MWPLAVFLALRQFAESLGSPDKVTPLSSIDLTGLALAAGWFLGNTLHAWSDPFGFTWYDCKTGSTVVATDCLPETLADYLRDARTTVDSSRRLRSRRVWLGAIAVFLLISSLIQWQIKRGYDTLPGDKKEQLLEFRKSLAVPGYNQPVPIQPVAAAELNNAATTQTTTADSATTVARYRYMKQSHVDADALARDPRAMSASERLLKALTKELGREQLRGYVIQATFAEFRDLFFAWEATDIFAPKGVTLPADETVAVLSTSTLLQKEATK
jgi:hypothetical protein